MKRVLLTGATGFIGRNAIAPLLAQGYEVHVASSKKKINASQGVHWHCVDLLNSKYTTRLVAEVRPTHLLHFAWYAEPGKYWTSAENLRWVQTSLTLMQAFTELGGKRVVIAGTCAEYDWGFGRCSEESTPLTPATLYGTCKNALQAMLMAWSANTGVSSAWGRIFSLYGPHEHPARLVASTISALLRGEVALCNNGNLIRDYLHVTDVASAFVALLDSDIKGAVNIGSGKGVALKDVVEIIGVKIGSPDLIRFAPNSLLAESPPLLIADTTRLSGIDWKPSFDLERGIDNTIDWWRKSYLEIGM